MNQVSKKGFTLLELLLVVAAIAILSVVVILIINPGESLKKFRDSQRLSDLASLKSAVAFYVTNTSTPYLAGSSNTGCKSGNSGGGSGTYGAGSKIYYSVASTSLAVTDATLDGGSGSVPAAGQVASTTLSLNDGTGWLPVNLESLTGGSPISNMPLDPVNSIASAAAVVSTDLVYRYACNSTNLTFEIDAQLESQTYTVDDDKRAKDGGNNSSLYETGTNLKILGTGTDF